MLLAWLLSMLMSVDWQRSLALSSPLIPALLCGWIIRLRRATADLRLGVALGMGMSGGYFALRIILAAFTTSDPQAIIEASQVVILVTPNDAALLLICTAFARLSPHPVARSVFITALLLSVVCIWILHSRLMALLLFAVVFCELFAPLLGIGNKTSVSRAQWLQRTLWLAVCAGLLLLIDTLLGWPLLGKFTGWFDNRWILWQAAWQQFLDSPLWGQGVHTFGVLYDPSLRADAHLIDSRSMPWPHNLYLELLAGGGVLLCAAAAILWLHTGILMLRMKAMPETRLHLLQIWVLFTLAATLELTMLRLWMVVTALLLITVTARIGGKSCPSSNAHRSAC